MNREQEQTRNSQFRTMVRDNPELPLLIEDLDLINPETRVRYSEVEENPISDSDIRKLRRIVERFFVEGRIYTPRQIVSSLSNGLSIGTDRANRGLKMMLSTGVLCLSSDNGIRVS